MGRSGSRRQWRRLRARERASRPGRWWVPLCGALTLIAAVASADGATADTGTLRIQGSTTFHSRLLNPRQKDLEYATGLRLSVVANKSIWGLIALLEGRADVAMISASLSGEIDAVRRAAPELPLERLEEHEVSRTRIVFAVHPSNPIRQLSLAQVRKILIGEITDWSQLGGPRLRIRVVATQDGGGTVVAVRNQVLEGAPISAPDAVRLESARHVVKVITQEPGALGVAQLGLARDAGLEEIATERHVEQRLSLVTLGSPGPQVRRLIEAARTLATEDLM